MWRREIIEYYRREATFLISLSVFEGEFTWGGCMLILNSLVEWQEQWLRGMQRWRDRRMCYSITNNGLMGFCTWTVWADTFLLILPFISQIPGRCFSSSVHSVLSSCRHDLRLGWASVCCCLLQPGMCDDACMHFVHLHTNTQVICLNAFKWVLVVVPINDSSASAACTSFHFSLLSLYKRGREKEGSLQSR